ncbi:MAG: cob(I)yrinic acid a,c-diamide adenosyltransferase [candidate division Zixibacteria bacterium]|nr:cob(I)yrinic acid a,c-diamide adenosyltransferase [candidate division Zixibacteria bacterium]
MTKKKTKGLVIVFTGDGKGKTTAALGMGLRAAGHGMKTLIIQFVKSYKRYGELKFVRKYNCGIQIKTMGKGYVKMKGDVHPFQEHVKAAKRTLEFAREQIQSRKFQLVVLDEINVALDKRLLTTKEVTDLIKQKPPSLHLVLTGRNAPRKLIQLADLVSEVKEIKHPFRKGILAQKGIEN